MLAVDKIKEFEKKYRKKLNKYIIQNIVDFEKICDVDDVERLPIYCFVLEKTGDFGRLGSKREVSVYHTARAITSAVIGKDSYEILENFEMVIGEMDAWISFDLGYRTALMEMNGGLNHKRGGF